MLQTITKMRMPPYSSVMKQVEKRFVINRCTSMRYSHSDTNSQEEEEEEMEIQVPNNYRDDERTKQAYKVILNGLNDAQVEAVTQPIESVTRVVAGPGAGKTRVLTCRIAYLLKKDMKDNSRILAVTFTKKASSEMKHRLDGLLLEDEEYQNSLSLYNSNEQHHVQDGMDLHSDDDDNVVVEEVVPSDGTSSTPILTTRVTLGTFHSICAKILRWHGQEISTLPSLKTYLPKVSETTANILDGSFAIIDQSEQLRILKNIITEYGIDLKGGGRGQADIRPITVLNALSQLKTDEAMDVMSDDDENETGRKISAKVRAITEQVYPAYRKAVLSQNALDFDDLILLCRELLKTNAEVRERMQRRWRHILVDEFQDTSEVQLDLVKLLSTSSLLIVGDGDQSIYSWRGAHAESMSDFVKAFNERSNGDERNEVDTVYLMENYRSTMNIVKAAQKVISNDSNSLSAQDSVRQDMKPMRGRGPPPRVLACADAQAEATFVVKEINKMSDNGTLNPSSSVALIYRTNAQSRALEEACVAHNVRYCIRGSAGTFYSRAEIKDCLCFMKWLYNSRDRSAMLRAFKTPSRGLGDVSINEFISYCEEVEKQSYDGNTPPTPLDVLLSLVPSNTGEERSIIPPDGIISTRTMNRLVPFASHMKKIRKKAETQTVSELLLTIIETLDLEKHFDSISKTRDEFADRWANVLELRKASERYTEEGGSLPQKESNDENDIQEMGPLATFLDDVSLLTDVEGDDEAQNGDSRLVADLMTIHASKGMEFDAVFLVGNEEGTFPTQRSIAEGEGSVELDEERRLCYVAMTRAKTHLVMTWRREVQQFFGQGFKYIVTERSRFLNRLVAKSSDEKKSKSFETKRTNVQNRKSSKTSRSSLQKERNVDDNEGAKYLLKKRAKSRADAEAWKNYNSRESRSPKRTTYDLKRNAVKRNSERTPISSRERPSSPHRQQSSTRASKVSADSGRVDRRRPRNEIKNDSNMPERRKYSTGPPDMALDSSLFYPVGSVVSHAIHGEGTVLTPKKGKGDDDKMLVYVKFKSGMEVDFPVTNGGLNIKH